MVLVLMLACASQVPVAPKPPPPELPPFEDPAAELLYHQFATWADGRGWTASPLERAGSLLERNWVFGAPGKSQELPTHTARLTLGVFAYDNAQSSYGLAWRGQIADEAGNRLSLYLASGARGFTAEQMVIDLRSGEHAPVELGAPLYWQVEERAPETSRPEGLAEVMAKLAEYQGDSFQQAAEQDLNRLAGAVLPVLESGDYYMCDRRPSPGHGIPGPCVPRRPTEAERATHRAAFDAELARRREVLGDGALWAGLLAQVAPAMRAGAGAADGSVAPDGN